MNRNVACLGECMIELSEHPDGSISRGFGGDTLNTALYMARLGMKVQYVTALGDDPLSDAMLAAWQGEGIGTQTVLRVPKRLPGLYMIRTDADGERNFLYWRDSAPVRQLLASPDTASVEAALCRAGLIYLSGITLSLFDALSRDRLFAILQRARRGGTKVAFDTNFRPRGWPDIDAARMAFSRAFAHADIVFASVEDHDLLFGSAEPERISVRLSDSEVGEFVIKLAQPACRVIASGEDIMVEAPPVFAVVDTTAAGDSFAAGYLAARGNGALPEAAALAGHRLAGLVVQHRGAIIPRAAMQTLMHGTST